MEFKSSVDDNRWSDHAFDTKIFNPCGKVIFRLVQQSAFTPLACLPHILFLDFCEGVLFFFFSACAPAFILSAIVSVSFSDSVFVLDDSSSPVRDAMYWALDSPPGRYSPLSFRSMFSDSIVGFFVSVVGDIFFALSGSWLSPSDLEIIYSALDSPPERDSPFSFRSTFDFSSR